MHPPDTEPTTDPSSHTPSMAPGVRGLDPQVFTTVTSWQRLPAPTHAAQARKTSRSRLSTALFKVFAHRVGIAASEGACGTRKNTQDGRD